MHNEYSLRSFYTGVLYKLSNHKLYKFWENLNCIKNCQVGITCLSRTVGE